MALTGTTNEEKIWNYLKAQGMTDAGTAGLMGNLYAESGLRPNNLQNSYEGKLGMADAEYTEMVDHGTYTNFVRDSAGYGLCQWTYWSRKEALLAYAKSAGKSIGDLEMQLGFLMKELSTGYKGVLNVLETAESVRAASDVVLLQFERPADQSETVKAKRASYGQKYFDKYSGKETGKMKLVESILTNNPCYKAGRKITVKGLMLHSVGCPQPSAKVFVKNWNKTSYDRACVHAFIDGNDGTVYQCLPWNHRGWHGGGSSNNTHIGVEMCEPGCIKYTGGATFTCSDPAAAKAVAKRTYDAAVELFAMLCRKFNLDPLGDGVIVSHKEGCKRGIASNHGDPEHLWNKLGTGYTMDGFRKAVKAAVGGAAVTTPPTSSPTVAAFNIGDTVDFTGDTHYSSSNSTQPVACKPGRAKVTAISKGAKHPYHLVRVSGGASTVYGWVDVVDIAGESSVADKPTYTVVAGDSLWGIAQKRLGNGNRYKEIMTLNGLTSTTIHPGQKLRLPS